MSKIKIVIVEDHPAMRFGLVQAISFEPDMQVVAEAGLAEVALKTIRSSPPDVALLDINLPGQMNGIQLLQQIVAERLPTRVFMLTGYSDPVQIKQAVLSGAAAYMTKDTNLENIIDGVRLVASGGYAVENRIFRDESELKNWLGNQEKTGPLSPLTDDPRIQKVKSLAPREMEIVTYIAAGKTNQEIADIMGIGHQTVKNYVTSILGKLQLQDRTQLATYAIRMGWGNAAP